MRALIAVGIGLLLAGCQSVSDGPSSTSETPAESPEYLEYAVVPVVSAYGAGERIDLSRARVTDRGRLQVEVSMGRCEVVAEVDIDEQADRIGLGVRVAPIPGTCTLEGHNFFVAVPLERPVGSRPVVDLYDDGAIDVDVCPTRADWSICNRYPGEVS